LAPILELAEALSEQKFLAYASDPSRLLCTLQAFDEKQIVRYPPVDEFAIPNIMDLECDLGDHLMQYQS
jgi:hypothetical protein